MYIPNNSSKGPEFGPQNSIGQIPSGSSITGAAKEIRFNDAASAALEKIRQIIKNAIPNNPPKAGMQNASEAICGEINMTSEQK